ncbi:TetR/AcrR family transcriptional regulator [Ideonella sp. BN130291]|uniref:TetR/AcrR family transcriptional regulator n=1 Tax=Ideonella sp. BN130291 TaxID=3112940 RepID=UPI002E27003B|nr:TetR/AcrR family transcriptional regulator [Ideonella sp. BN130291]
MAPSAHDRILQAAADLFLAQGFEATSMEQVRQRAEVSNGSLYHHCPTKNHLARALYEAALRDYHAALLKVLAGGASAEEGVRGLIAAHIAWVLKQPQQARVLHELRRTTAIAGAEPDWGGLNAEAFDTLRRWCDGEAAAGRMQALQFGVWLALVFAPVLQLTPQWARQPRPSVPPKLRAVLAEAAWRAVAP